MLGHSLNFFRPIKVGVSVRLLSPHGTYPRGLAYRQADSAIVVRHGCIGLITKFAPVVSPDDYFSEVEWLLPFETRVLGAAIVARAPDSGAMALYPAQVEYQSSDPNLDLLSEDVLEGLVDELELLVQKSNGLSIHLPPCAGGRTYDFNDYTELERERLHAVMAAIDVSDHLLVRGLGALVRAGMLSVYPEFQEQACTSLWIAQEASLYLFIRKLREAGQVGPTSRDVGQLLDAAFESKNQSDGYFEDFYEERVKTLHPESRFGTYPGAPLCSDEYYQLLASLTAIYDYLLTEHVAPCFLGK